MKTKLRPLAASLIFFLAALSFQGLFAQTAVMPLPPHNSVYSGNSRGLWFIAPIDFAITGVRAPTEIGTGNQAIHIVSFPTAPPLFGTTTNVFTTLFYGNNITGSGFVPQNIQVSAGDVIGILAVRASATGASQTSYANLNNPYQSTVGGHPVTLNRLGWQGQITNSAAVNFWTEAASHLGRVEMEYVVFSETDVGLNYFNFPSDTICAGMQSLSVNLKNHGPAVLSDVSVISIVNNDTLPVFNWSGTLAVDDSVDVVVGSYNFLNGVSYDIKAYTSDPNGINDTINHNDTIVLASITVLPDFFTGLIPSYQLDFCDGDSMRVSALSPTANAWQWFYNGQIINGAIDSFLYVSQQGIYQVWLADGVCSRLSDTIVAITHPSPLATITSYTPTSFCHGDSVWLFANTGTGLTYEWRRDGISITGATASTYLAKENGIYTVTTTNVGNCSTTSDTLGVNVKPVHPIDLGPDLVVCEDITVVIDAGAGADTYLWSNGLTTQTISFDTAIAGLGAKTYSVTATLNGCESRDEVRIEFINCTSIDVITNSNDFTIFPNPNKGEFTVSFRSFGNPNLTINITDVSGRLIYNESIRVEAASMQKTFNLQIPAGVYLIEIFNESSSNIKHLIVK